MLGRCLSANQLHNNRKMATFKDSCYLRLSVFEFVFVHQQNASLSLRVAVHCMARINKYAENKLSHQTLPGHIRGSPSCKCWAAACRAKFRSKLKLAEQSPQGWRRCGCCWGGALCPLVRPPRGPPSSRALTSHSILSISCRSPNLTIIHCRSELSNVKTQKVSFVLVSTASKNTEQYTISDTTFLICTAACFWNLVCRVLGRFRFLSISDSNSFSVFIE